MANTPSSNPEVGGRSEPEAQRAFISWVEERGAEAEQLLQGDLELAPRHYFEQNSSQYATEFYGRVDRWRAWLSALITGIYRRVVHAEHLVRDAQSRFAEERLLTFAIADFNEPTLSRAFDLRDRTNFSNGAGWSELGAWFRRGREEPLWVQVRQSLLSEVRSFVSMIRDQLAELTLIETTGLTPAARVGDKVGGTPLEDQSERFADFERRGEGAHASVWKARDTKLGRVVAIRIVRTSAGGDEEVVAHARTMAKPPQHPNIVTVYELVTLRDPGEQRSVVAAVMEFVDGDKLNTVLTRCLSVGDALKICSGILAALAQYHEHKLAHLDLHPENVLVSSSMDAKLLDPKTYRTDLFATTQLLRDQIGRDIRDAAFLIRQTLVSSEFGMDVPARFYQLAGSATSTAELLVALETATTSHVAHVNAELLHTEPAAVFAAAIGLARTADHIGWRQLENRLRRDYASQMILWRRSREPVWAGERNREGGIAATNALLDIAMPRVTFALVGGYTKPALSEPRRVIEDVMSIPDWRSDGATSIVEAPRTLVFLFHYVQGALFMMDGRLDEALHLGSTPIPHQQRSGVSPLWKERDMTGWPRLLGGTCTWAWEYLHALWANRPVLEELFAMQNDFDVGLAAYSMLLSVVELATGAAKAKPTNFENVENIQLDFPPMFVGMPNTVVEQAIARTIANRTLVEHVARYTGASVDTMRTMWPAWKRLFGNFRRDVFDRWGDLDLSRYGDLA